MVMNRLPSERDRDAASGLAAKPFGWHRRLGAKDDFRAAQCAFGFIQPGPRHIGIAVRAIDVIEKGEEDPVVGCKIRVKNHVQKANVLGGRRRQVGDTSNGFREHTLGIQDPYTAGQPVREENITARQECEAPWRGHIVDQRRDSEGR